MQRYRQPNRVRKENKLIAILFSFILLGGLCVNGFAQTSGTLGGTLGGTKKIYLGDLGKDISSDLVKEKLRVAFSKQDRFVLVDKVEEADAVLTGTVYVPEAADGTLGHGRGDVRLVDPDSKRGIWLYEYKHGFFIPGNPYEDMANKILDALVKDSKKAEKKK